VLPGRFSIVSSCAVIGHTTWAIVRLLCQVSQAVRVLILGSFAGIAAAISRRLIPVFDSRIDTGWS
jgi:hypothetical protein